MSRICNAWKQQNSKAEQTILLGKFRNESSMETKTLYG